MEVPRRGMFPYLYFSKTNLEAATKISLRISLKACFPPFFFLIDNQFIIVEIFMYQKRFLQNEPKKSFSRLN